MCPSATVRWRWQMPMALGPVTLLPACLCLPRKALADAPLLTGRAARPPADADSLGRAHSVHLRADPHGSRARAMPWWTTASDSWSEKSTRPRALHPANQSRAQALQLVTPQISLDLGLVTLEPTRRSVSRKAVCCGSRALQMSLQMVNVDIRRLDMLHTASDSKVPGIRATSLFP